ncbi:hypothetical protein AKI39_19370 [Bordetella sp. H567]|uniref:hypothetical protein n=1 Tax=Bordetella sp. H567 TaxID=1697043 RepID=UPI00081CAB2C|nr:hypothetical protein [Bordetella sp. H567]AOB32418.1 hypothetical protein AKI39_19370 [Bordetella sp. H567]
MSESIGMAAYRNYAGYGESIKGRLAGSAYADVPVQSWAQAITAAMAMCNEISQSYGEWLVQNNKTSAQLIRKTRQNTELVAAVGDFLELFPIPSGKENNNPSLKELQEILKQRAEDRGDKDHKSAPAYEDEKLTKLNEMLKALGLVPMTENSKKSDFETLKTRLDGLRDEIAGFQTMTNTKQGMLVGNISQHQTQVQGLIKSSQSIGMGFARIVGSV